jgi:hypothetical protein
MGENIVFQFLMNGITLVYIYTGFPTKIELPNSFLVISPHLIVNAIADGIDYGIADGKANGIANCMANGIDNRIANIIAKGIANGAVKL